VTQHDTNKDPIFKSRSMAMAFFSPPLCRKTTKLDSLTPSPLHHVVARGPLFEAP
jgi:hypothetical protein